MANNLGFIDAENNDLFINAVDLGALLGTNTASGLIQSLVDDNSGDIVDFYRFELNTAAPINSYIELTSPDVVNIEAIYQIHLYRYDAVTNNFTEIKQSYQLPNNPYNYRIDLTGLTSGTYVFGVTGAEWDWGSATGLYNLRMSIPSPSLPGKVINGTDNSEQLLGGSEENTINGKGGNDILKGGAGDDTLNGGLGNDSLTGGEHSDILNGGEGVDKVVESGNLAKFILGNDRLVGNGVDVLLSIEQAQLTGGDGDNTLDAASFTLGSVTLNGGGGYDTLLGGSKNDRLTGGDGSDYLDGGTGQDAMIGGSGGDSYVVDNSGDTVTETDTFGYDTVDSFVSFTLGNNLEKLNLKGAAAISGTGNGLDNPLTGNSANNTLTGLGGNDTLDGGQGSDTLIGGAGDDTYTVDSSTDVIVETSTSELELVNSSAFQYTLSANLENLTLIGNGRNGTGNALNNKISGNGLSNILNGGGGDDIAWGNYGNDTLNGGYGADLLYGQIDNDILNGGFGNDYLDGGSGNDRMNGGAGKDSMSDSFGDDIYVFQYGQSSFSAFDQVDYFTVGSDKIDLLSTAGGALGKPVGLTRAANIDEFVLSKEAVNQLFTDANGAQAGNQALGTNSAVVVQTYGMYDAYLIVNDNVVGFQESSDLVINLATFGMLPPLGVISVDTFFV
jgi:Ca2+-binding RTX toxin-like protein